MAGASTARIAVIPKGTGTNRRVIRGHPKGDQPLVERLFAGPVAADTFAGRVHVEWDNSAPVTPFGQMPFFIEFVKQGGLFDSLVADCLLYFTSPNAPPKRDVIGTIFLSVLAGHNRYAHMTTVRCDPVNPPLLGMTRTVSEDAVRRGLDKIEEEAGETWVQGHLDYTTRPLLSEPWILDIDTTVKPLSLPGGGADDGAPAVMDSNVEAEIGASQRST